MVPNTRTSASSLRSLSSLERSLPRLSSVPSYHETQSPKAASPERGTPELPVLESDFSPMHCKSKGEEKSRWEKIKDMGLVQLTYIGLGMMGQSRLHTHMEFF